MDNNYSLSDIASVMGGGIEGGSSLILIILFVLLFGGGNLFGRGGDYSQFATSASQQDILFNQKFSDLATKINAIGDGISSLGYSQLQQMDANTSSINGNIVNEGRAIQAQLCAINSNIDNKFANLEKSQLEQRIAEQAQQISQLQMAQQMCGVVKYPLSTTYSAQNPYCNCNAY